MIRIFVLIIITLLIETASLHAKWKWSNPLPHGNNIAEMAYSSDLGLAVQVCDKGQIYISYDFYNWTPVESGVTNALRSVTFFGSKIIVTGENGLVLFSDDELNFYQAKLSPTTTDWLEGVASGSLYYNSALTSVAIAVGDSGSIYSSFDGTNWIKRTQSNTNWLRGICIGARSGTPIAVAVGENGTILTSQNLTTWTKVSTTTSQHINRVAFTNGSFYAVGEGGTALIGSGGGSSWISETTGATNSLNAIALVGTNQRMYVGNNEVRYYNGSVWANLLSTFLSNKPAAWNYTSILNIQRFTLLGGSTGMLYEGYKTNGTFYWIPSQNSVRQWVWDLTTDCGFYLAVGNNGVIMTSADGANWELELVPSSVTNSVMLGVGGDTNILIAVGSEGTILYSTNEYLPNYSTNYIGTNAVVTTNFVSALGVLWYASPKVNTNTLQGVCKWNTQYFIAGDNGIIFKSSYVSNWTKVTTPTTNNLTGLASSSKYIVAVGSKGTILYSSNGDNWTLVNTGTTNWLYKVRYLNNNFITIGNNGIVFTSPDGINWTQRTTGSAKMLTDVTYLNGVYYVIGSQGTIISSTNLVNWSQEKNISGKSLYATGTIDGRLVVAGVEGVILRNQIIPQTTPVDIVKYNQTLSYTNGLIYHLFLFYGKTDQQFTLQSITNLNSSNWSDSYTLEIDDSSGLLYFYEYDYITNRPYSEFFRTKLIY